MTKLEGQLLDAAGKGSVSDIMVAILAKLEGLRRVETQEPEPTLPVPVDVAGAVEETASPSAAFSRIVAVNYQQLPTLIAVILKEMPEVEGWRRLV